MFVWRLQRKEAEETYLKMEINKMRIKNSDSFCYVAEICYFGNIIFLLLLVFFSAFFELLLIRIIFVVVFFSVAFT